MITPSKSSRRPLKFKTPAELHDELDRLKQDPHQKLGNWTLPQACRHLAMTIELNLTPPDRNEPTAEEIEMKKKFFGMVMGPQGMPDNLPIGNAALVPDETCTDAEIERLKAAFDKLQMYPHSFIKVGRCGPVPVSELTELHLAHAAHHLSFFEPPRSGPMRQLPKAYRDLKFADPQAAIAEIEMLQVTPHQQLGAWSLPMIAWHAVKTMNVPFHPACEPVATEDQATLQRRFLDTIIQTGRPPEGTSPPVEVMPRCDCGDQDIETLKGALRQMADYNQSNVNMGPFGPVPVEKFRKVHLVHLAHHLGFLVPVLPATQN